MSIWYVTREAIKAALDIKETARNNQQIDRCIAAATSSAEGILHRKFFPFRGTRYFDWPDRDQSFDTIYFREYGLVSATSITFADRTLLPTEYFLGPANTLPYRWLESNKGNGRFESGDTSQRNVAISGDWGWDNVFDSAGTIAASIASTSATTITVDADVACAAGVGSLLQIDSEWLAVTGRAWVDTTDDTTGSLASNVNATAVPVVSGSAFRAGERILIDTEIMLILDVVGNTLIVKRAWDGSSQVAHDSGASIYASRSLTVKRGVSGSTAATHSNSAAVAIWAVPPLLWEFTLALTLTMLLQSQAGYSRTVGSGESEREASGRGLAQIQQQAMTELGRSAIMGAV